MSAMSNSVGEGIDSGFGDKFVNTGYGTYNGQGNVPTGAENMSGTGFDEHGQVKTKFGKWNISYDAVGLGTATTGTTSNYDFPPGHLDPGDVGGLTDISIPAEGHSTMGSEPQVKRVNVEDPKPHSEGEAGQGGGSGAGGG